MNFLHNMEMMMEKDAMMIVTVEKLTIHIMYVKMESALHLNVYQAC